MDEQGKITVAGVLHKEAHMVDVTVNDATTSDFIFGPPPETVTEWAVSWTTSVRPSHLGSTEVCARAEREPGRFARILRSITVVDLIPPSTVPDLAVTAITTTSAKVTWGEATDNYGLAGYDVTVDGGTPVRTTIGTRSYSITGLSAASDHTVSVVAVDLADNTSTAPATVSFTTAAVPPPSDVFIEPHEGYAAATWHPNPDADATYKVFLDGVHVADFPLDLYCQDANGNPASPCAEQDVISYTIGDLEEDTPYAIQIQAWAATGVPSRELNAVFTTTTSDPIVPDAVVQRIASESSQCAGMGGSFYVSPSQRGRVPLPAGSTLVSAGCYIVPDHSCIDAFLPLSGDSLVNCTDDVTELLFAVAPPGGGPVISSMDGIGAPPNPDNLLVETVTWCTENDACTVVVEKAVEVVATEAVLVAAGATVSFVVVLAATIVIAATLTILLELLFPDPIGFAGLIEYPIHHDTDFDTFDNWGQSHGAWINSLKTFAEVVKTTKQVAAQHSLPFAWDDDIEHDLKTAIDLACGAAVGRPPNVGNVCPENLTVYVPGGKSYNGGPMMETGIHIVDALGNGVPMPTVRSAWFYPAYSKSPAMASRAPYNHARDWYDAPQFQPNDCNPRPAGKPICDEFPFFSTNQTVDLTLPDRSLVASVRPVPEAEQRPQGQDLAGFYRRCLDNKDGEHFIVLPIRSWVEAGGPSFGFKVNQGGASLCREPRPPTP